MARSAHLKSRVSSSSDVISCSSSDWTREGGIDDENDDAAIENAPLSCFLKSREHEREKKKKKKKKKKKNKRDLEEFSRVLIRGKRSRCGSPDDLDQVQVRNFDLTDDNSRVIDKNDDDAVIDNAPLSWFLKSREYEGEKEKKNRRKRDLEEFSRVLTRGKRSRCCSPDDLDQVQAQDFDFTDDKCRVEEEEMENENSDVAIFRTGDIVWAKALPYTWWPGLICRRDGNKVLVSFYGCDRTRRFHNSELRCFEKNFEAISKRVRWKLSDAIDCALAELGRRLVLNLMCPCQGSSMDNIDVEGVKSEKVFQPVVVLELVLRMAVFPWVDDAETVSAIGAGAQVNAFRRYISIKHDWIYQETMMLSETGLASDDNSEANMRSTYREMLSHSSDDDEKAYSVTQEPEFSDEGQEDKHEAFAEQVEMVSGFCKKNSVEHLHEILTHLRCLALDPFYSGAESLWVGSASVCQKILMYRALVYHNVLDLVPNKRTYHIREAETSKVRVASTLDAASHLGNVDTKTLAEENIDIINGHANQEFSVCIQHSNKAGVEGRSEAVKVDCSLSYMDEFSTIEPVVKDVPHIKHTPICNHETGIKVLEVYRLDSVSHIRDAATKTQHGDNSDIANEDAHESKVLSRCLENAVNIPLCNKSGTDGRSVDVKVDCNFSCVLELSPSETVFEDVIGTHSDDRVGDATNKTSLVSHLSDTHINVHPCNQASVMANISNKEVSLGMVSADFTEGKRRFSQPIASDSSCKLHKGQTSYPRTMIYASPLATVSNGNAKFKSSGSNNSSEYPTSLHMKFPRDFKLPSKDELLKQFRSFGPLDNSKTKVFFYTGSAQVVFLHQLDAEVAYHYAKRKKIFFSQANVRFWLDRREHSGPPLPFSTVRPSALNLKSCLKTSNPLGKDKRTPQQVKFLPVSQTISLSATTVTKNGAFTPSDSCKFSREVGQDISVQMLVLLETCNQLMCKIKDSLGLQSYYSILTQNYCHVPKLDDE